MWQELASMDVIAHDSMREYLLANPLASLIDFEDEDNAELEIKRFAVFNNSGKTVAFLECDRRMIDSTLAKDKLNGQLSDLSQKLNRERDFFN